MVPNDRQTHSPRPISTMFFLWTIRKQDQIARFFTMHMWSAVSAVLVMALIGFVSLEMALQIILIGGVATAGLLWVLIERRRSWLLGISDPKLKAEAHRVMIDYLAQKMQSRPGCPGQLNGSDAHPTASCL